MSILYFPQLATGALTQFPTNKDFHARTILNRSIDGGEVRMADSDGNLTRWDLQYAGLTDGEVQTLEELFMECEGRLQTFVFLDPFANLLRWSGDLSNPVWESSMLAAPDLEDPTGGIDAWRVTNAAQSGQTLGQSVDAPGWYRYTFSAWVRSESASALALQLGSGSGAVDMIRPVSPEWQRIAITGELGGTIRPSGVQSSFRQRALSTFTDRNWKHSLMLQDIGAQPRAVAFYAHDLIRTGLNVFHMVPITTRSDYAW